jgi:hypothetical protein
MTGPRSIARNKAFARDKYSPLEEGKRRQQIVDGDAREHVSVEELWAEDTRYLGILSSTATHRTGEGERCLLDR